MLAVRVKAGASVGQDFTYKKWPIPPATEDTILETDMVGSHSGRVWCIAAHFGGTPYGCGRIFVREDDLLPVETVKPRHDCAAWVEEGRGCCICGNILRGVSDEGLANAAIEVNGLIMELEVDSQRLKVAEAAIRDMAAMAQGAHDGSDDAATRAILRAIIARAEAEDS